uniref:Chemosensory protein 5 n=1 Tax=Encarsia formosa TaxID=32400 RepID=A0A6M5CGU8_ENCFO|nr:chemosensory protein 5 [Encarsia formosa]
MNAVLMILGLLAGMALGQDQYTTKYDNIDVEAIIKNERLLKNYVGCLLDNNPCTPEGTELKKNLPDALETNCKSCSDIQKRISDRLTHFLIDNRPDDWALLEQKYDPTGSYKKQYLG